MSISVPYRFVITGGLRRCTSDSLLATGVHRTPVLSLTTSHTTVCCGVLALRALHSVRSDKPAVEKLCGCNGLRRCTSDSLLATGVHRTPVLSLATSHTTVCCGVLALRALHPVRCQYSILLRKSACPGTDSPASERVPESRRDFIHSGSLLPRPTSTREPTTARTMFLRNLSAPMVKTR